MIMYMATKKQQSRKNKSRSYKKQQRKQQKKQHFFIGGTCAMCGSCANQNSLSPLFRGGKNCTWKRRRGGNDVPPSFNGLPLRYYYAENSFNNDPRNPSVQIASRQLPQIKGGKNSTKKSKKRGGALLGFSLFNGQMATAASFNPLNTIGDIATSQIGSNYISGSLGPSILPNPSVFSQPVETKYNLHNKPLA
jgi:hypothetical protein